MKKEFLTERNGRTFVLYAGLLDLAHERGLKAITTTLVQIPSDLNGQMAIVHATVETSQGTFTGLGDAAPDNVSRMMVPHLIRMAETRSKARALRDAVNVGVTALEELGDVNADTHEDEEPGQRARSSIASYQPRRSFAPPADYGEPGDDERSDPLDLPTARAERTGGGGNSIPATPKQLQTIQRMARAAGKTIEVEGLTRAQASDLISGLISEMEARGAGN